MFKVGDKVCIVCKVDSYSEGWKNNWYSTGMDSYVGNNKIYTIASIQATGIRFVEDPSYGWPAEALCHAKNYSQEQRLINKIKSLYRKSSLPFVQEWAK